MMMMMMMMIAANADVYNESRALHSERLLKEATRERKNICITVVWLHAETNGEEYVSVDNLFNYFVTSSEYIV
jgi:predicted GIY-YIG superfamily endonuclease